MNQLAQGCQTHAPVSQMSSAEPVHSLDEWHVACLTDRVTPTELPFPCWI